MAENEERIRAFIVNPAVAYANLTQAAAAHLADPEYQLQYVSENLAAGPWWGQ